jgi:hypothetical protein
MAGAGRWLSYKSPLRADTCALCPQTRLIITDNGDPTSFAPFQSPGRKAFNGWCLAIVRARSGRGGVLRVTAVAEGLAGASLVVRAVARG